MKRLFNLAVALVLLCALVPVVALGAGPIDAAEATRRQAIEAGSSETDHGVAGSLDVQVPWLMKNQLSGSIPPELGNLNSMLDLSLGSNRLAGSIPAELRDLTHLWEFYLSHNQLSGSVPSELGHLTELYGLGLDNNQLSGALPLSLTNLTALEMLFYHNTDLCEPDDSGFQDWLAGIPNVQSTGVTRGDAADSQWSGPVRLSQHSLYETSPDIARGGATDVHVVWSDSAAGYDISYVASFDGAWQFPTTIAITDGESRDPSVAVDSTGGVHVVWVDMTEGNTEVLYSTKPAGGQWSTPTNLSGDPAPSDFPCIAVDSQDNTHVVWEGSTGQETDILYVTKAGSEAWVGPVNLSSTPASSGRPRVSTDNLGNVHVAWQEQVGSAHDIFYVQKPSGGSWASPVNVSDNASESTAPDIAADDQGEVHLVWEDNGGGSQDVFYIARSTDGLWSTPINVSDNSSSSVEPALDIGPGDIPHVAWIDNAAGNYHTFHHTIELAPGSWMTPTVISALGTVTQNTQPSPWMLKGMHTSYGQMVRLSTTGAGGNGTTYTTLALVIHQHSALMSRPS